MDPNHPRWKAAVMQSQELSLFDGPQESGASGASRCSPASLSSNAAGKQQRSGGRPSVHQAPPTAVVPAAHTEVQQVHHPQYMAAFPAGLVTQHADFRIPYGMSYNSTLGPGPGPGDLAASQQSDWLTQPFGNGDDYNRSSTSDFNLGLFPPSTAAMPWQRNASLALPNLPYAYPQPNHHHPTWISEHTSTSSDMQPFSAVLQLSDPAMYASVETTNTTPLDDTQLASLRHLNLNPEPGLVSPPITSDLEPAVNYSLEVSAKIRDADIPGATTASSGYEKPRDADVRKIEEKARQGVAKGFDDLQTALDRLPHPYKPAARNVRRTRKAILNEAAQALSSFYTLLHQQESGKRCNGSLSSITVFDMANAVPGITVDNTQFTPRSAG